MKLLLICSVASLAACTQAAHTTPAETPAPPTETTAPRLPEGTNSTSSEESGGFVCHPVSESGAGVMFYCGLFNSGERSPLERRCSTQALDDYPRALAAYFIANPDKHFGESDPVTHNGRTCGFMVTFRAFVTEP